MVVSIRGAPGFSRRSRSASSAAWAGKGRRRSGRGVARALIEAVYAAADAAGVPAVYWLTAEDNYAGRMLYDKVAQRSPFIRYQRRLG